MLFRSTDENNPDGVYDHYTTLTDIFNDMLYAKRVVNSNATKVIPNYSWVSGEVYQAFENNINISQLTSVYNSKRPMYIVTDQFNVYKCISNNSNAASTVKPTHTSTTIATLSDSYQWKYMFTVSDSDLEKFYSTNWIPVSTLKADNGSNQWDVQQAAAAPYYHGADPEKELNATNLMVKVRVAGSEGDTIPDENDYRQISILSNPVYYGSYYTAAGGGSNTITLASAHWSAVSGDSSLAAYPTAGKKIIILSGTGAGQIREIASNVLSVVTVTSNWDVTPTTDSVYGIISTSTVANQCVVLTLNSSPSFTNDSVYTQTSTSASGRAVKFDSTNKKLYLTDVSGTFTAGGGTVNGAAVNTVQEQTLYPNVGDILYYENRKKITRYTDQIEDIKIVLEF